MDFSINYYQILEVSKESSEKEIKKSYYKLSFVYHPDKNKDVDVDRFKLISESYSILSDEKLRSEYDLKSKWGRRYDERSELFDFEFSNTSRGWDEDKFTESKKNDSLNVIRYVDDTFDGNIEYERWVICKICKGSGKDLKSKIEIKDVNGNIKYFESEDGCDFCEGRGKDDWGNKCNFCFGQGKIGSKNCLSCKGEKRILGKQKLTGIIFDKNEKDLKVEFMGNFMRDIPGKVGHLWLVRKD
jgi:DnaJ-class molecular chaperone